MFSVTLISKELANVRMAGAIIPVSGMTVPLLERRYVQISFFEQTS